MSMIDLWTVPLPFAGRATGLTNGPESECVINFASTRKRERTGTFPDRIYLRAERINQTRESWRRKAGMQGSS